MSWRCRKCGVILTEEEIKYYHNYCEGCEFKMHQELMDEMLDR
ncbi:hypothetical protein [Cetobacterium sp.]